MFKLRFIELCNVSNDISLDSLQKKLTPARLNKLTVRIYHILFGSGK
jgi:hypothetical protein